MWMDLKENVIESLLVLNCDDFKTENCIDFKITKLVYYRCCHQGGGRSVVEGTTESRRVSDVCGML